MRKLLFAAFILTAYTELNAQSLVNASAQATEVTIFTNGAEIVNTLEASVQKGSTSLMV